MTSHSVFAIPKERGNHNDTQKPVIARPAGPWQSGRCEEDCFVLTLLAMTSPSVIAIATVLRLAMTEAREIRDKAR